jgi:hypothetical protein
MDFQGLLELRTEALPGITDETLRAYLEEPRDSFAAFDE